MPNQYLHTSLPLENMEERMTSGAIQAYVPAALILVVLCHSLAKPKSVIFNILLLRSPFSTFSSISTGEKRGGGRQGRNIKGMQSKASIYAKKILLEISQISRFSLTFSYSNIPHSVTSYFKLIPSPHK